MQKLKPSNIEMATNLSHHAAELIRAAMDAEPHMRKAAEHLAQQMIEQAQAILTTESKGSVGEAQESSKEMLFDGSIWGSELSKMLEKFGCHQPIGAGPLTIIVTPDTIAYDRYRVIGQRAYGSDSKGCGI